MLHSSNASLLLKNIPDFFTWNEALSWIKKGQHQLQQCDPHPEHEMMTLEWTEIGEQQSPFFGLYPSLSWRKFVLATYFADLVSYPELINQVNFERLLFVMHAFPQGFRTWWVRLSDGNWWPVGYTGWYPMHETTFDIFEKKPEALTNRMVVPDCLTGNAPPYLYLFNFSAVPQFQKGSLTHALMQRFSQDIENIKPDGITCITVSEDGKRIAKRFGMIHAGHLSVNGSQESVFIKRFS